MNILTLVSEYPSVGDEIPNTFVHKYIKALKKRGIGVYVLLMDFRSIRRKRPFGLSTYEYDGVKVYRYSFPCGPFYGILEHIMKASIGKLYRYALRYEEKPDVVHAHFGHMGYVAAELKRKYGIPYIVTEHSSLLLADGNKNRKSKYYIGYSAANRVVSVSNELKRRIELSNTANEVMVIPNILGESFKLVESEREEIFTIISIGRVICSKRFDLLINAVKDITYRGNNVKLWIVGEGDERESLEELVFEYGLGNVVSFLGKKEPRELCELLNKAHMFALPSDVETFGVVYIEANACGLPVVATDCGGPSDIVNEMNGVIVPRNDCKALAAAIMYIKDNYDRYCAEGISRTAIEKYGEKAIIDQYTSVYERIIYEDN